MQDLGHLLAAGQAVGLSRLEGAKVVVIVATERMFALMVGFFYVLMYLPPEEGPDGLAVLLRHVVQDPEEPGYGPQGPGVNVEAFEAFGRWKVLGSLPHVEAVIGYGCWWSESIMVGEI